MRVPIEAYDWAKEVAADVRVAEEHGDTPEPDEQSIADLWRWADALWIALEALVTNGDVPDEVPTDGTPLGYADIVDLITHSDDVDETVE